MWIFVTVGSAAGALARSFRARCHDRWRLGHVGEGPSRLVRLGRRLSVGQLAHRTARTAVLAGLPALTSCAGVVSRSRIISFLEAVQRPFDLHDRTWLGIPAALPAHFMVSAFLGGALAWLWRPKGAGVLVAILILAKEGVDLMIITLYQPLTWAYASGSVVDVLVSVAGASLGLWVCSRVPARVVEHE